MSSSASSSVSSATGSVGIFWTTYKKPILIGAGVAVVIAIIYYILSGRSEGFNGQNQQQQQNNLVGGYPEGYMRYPGREGFDGPLQESEPEGFYADQQGQTQGEQGSPKKIVLFWVAWCPNCTSIKSKDGSDQTKSWDQLESKYKGRSDIIVEAIDCDEKPEVATQFGIGGFPTIVLFKDGKSITYDGDRSLESLDEFLNTA